MCLGLFPATTRMDSRVRGNEGRRSGNEGEGARMNGNEEGKNMKWIPAFAGMREEGAGMRKKRNGNDQKKEPQIMEL